MSESNPAPGPWGQIREAIDTLEAKAVGFARVDGHWLCGVRRDLVRAYVYAVHTGSDPARAIGRVNFGVDSLEQLGAAGRGLCRAQAKRLAAIDVTIPRRSLVHGGAR